MQVVHLAVVVRSRQVVGAETAEEQSQEEVQQLQTDRERDGASVSRSRHQNSLRDDISEVSKRPC